MNMSYKSYKSNKSNSLIPPHGGYRKLKSYQTAEIIYDLTVKFCNNYKSYLTYKTYEQMTGAARSGKQNIAEASMNSGTSKKIELKLVGIARGSLEELLLDFEDFLRQNSLPLWEKSSPKAQKIRALAYKSNKSHKQVCKPCLQTQFTSFAYKTYSDFLRSEEETANCIICLIHQANYLLDKQLSSLEQQFLKEGGFTERLYRSRQKTRKEKKT